MGHQSIRKQQTPKDVRSKAASTIKRTQSSRGKEEASRIKMRNDRKGGGAESDWARGEIGRFERIVHGIVVTFVRSIDYRCTGVPIEARR